MVPGSGPRPNWLAYVGEAPGADEVESGMAFTGPSGGILWQWSWREMGVLREQVYVSNVIKERLTEEEEKKGLTPAALQAWHDMLELELLEVRPTFVLALGKYATQFFLGPGARMEITHGMPYRVQRAWGPVVVVPAFHPAAGMHESTRLAYTWGDLVAAGRVLRGQGPAPTDVSTWGMRGPGRSAQGTSLGLKSVVAIDTEWLPSGEPWGLSYSDEPGYGYVIRADNKLELSMFRALLEVARPTVWLHNALADLRPLRMMGIDLLAMGLDVRDSMIYAFHKGMEPQGLKALNLRHFGYRMRDYDDVVTPHHEAALKPYLEQARAALDPGYFYPIGKRGKPLKARRAPAGPEYRVVNLALNDLARGKPVVLGARWEGWEPARREVIEAVMGEPAPRKGLHLVPEDEAVAYSGDDAIGTRILGPKVEQWIEPSQQKVLAMDHARLTTLDRMQEVGLQVDRRRLAELEGVVEAALQETLEIIRIITGDPDFNPGSGDQVAEYARLEWEATGTFALERMTRSKMREATDKRALAAVTDHVLPVLVLRYRGLQKLLGTYIRPLPGFLDENDIVHPRVRHTRVPSGRLAMSDPNLMAQPVRDELGRRVRGCYVARPGHMMGSWDHSQIEWRAAADDSRDERMVGELLRGEDAHTNMALRIFGDKAYRQAAKTLNYGMLYLAEAPTLHQTAVAGGVTDFGQDDWVRFREEWWRTYPGVQAAVGRVVAKTRQLGYAEDRWGRRRWLPGVTLEGKRWPYSYLRAESERQAWSMRIQGGAQGFIERAQIRVGQEILPMVREMGYWVELLLQIHDELLLEFDEGAKDILDALMLDVMTADSSMMAVPIEASSTFGRDWGEVH